MPSCEICGKEFDRTNNLKRHQQSALCMVRRKDLDLARKDEELARKDEELARKDEELARRSVELVQETLKWTKERNAFEAVIKDVVKEVEHLQTVLGQKADEINKLESRICKYEQTIADIARQPRTSTSTSTSTNKFVVNFPPLTTEHLQSNAQFLSMDHLKKGFQGYAEYALEFPLKGMVTCTDFSRRKVKYNNEEGDLVVDPDMKKLCTNLFSAIRSRNQELTNEYMTEMKEKAESGEWNRNEIQDLMFEAITRNGDVASIADGGRPEAITDFVKWVCSGLTSSTHDGSCSGT